MKVYAVVEAVLLFGADAWVHTETISQRIKAAHVSFLRQVTRKQATWRRDGSWRHITSEEVIQGAGTKMLRTYVVRRQETAAECVSTRTFFMSVREIQGSKEGGDSRCRGQDRKQQSNS